MWLYLLRRLLLIPPTLVAIMALNFAVIQLVPGGPIERILARSLEKVGGEATGRISGAGGELAASEQSYRGAQGLDPAYIKQLEHQFGFDQPLGQQFLRMITQYIQFDFGTSYFRDVSVLHLIFEKLPVSISLGLWSTLCIYLLSIPMGIAKAVRDGSHFDIWTSSIVVIGNAIPSFLFAILLIVLFASGQYFQWFPLRGITSEGWSNFGFIDKILDYFWHMALPILALTIGGFAGLTLLTKNAFLEEINKHYVLTARAKGLTEKKILYGHVFRNAMLLIIAGFPSAFIGILFTGSLLIEVIFSLDGLGLLGFEAAVNRDYTVMLASLYFFSLLGLIMSIIGDVMYHLVDPRIDFESREF